MHRIMKISFVYQNPRGKSLKQSIVFPSNENLE